MGREKVAKFISLLTVKALEWATTMWEAQDHTLSSFACLIELFDQVCEHWSEREDAGQHLLSLSQCNHRAAEYTLKFDILATGSGWNSRLPSVMDWTQKYWWSLHSVMKMSLWSHSSTLPSNLTTFFASTLHLANRWLFLNLCHLQNPLNFQAPDLALWRDRRLHELGCFYCDKTYHTKDWRKPLDTIRNLWSVAWQTPAYQPGDQVWFIIKDFRNVATS